MIKRRFDCFQLNSNWTRALQRQGLLQGVEKEPIESQFEASGSTALKRRASEPEAPGTELEGAMTDCVATAGAEAANASKVGAVGTCTEGGAEGKDAPGTSTARGAPGNNVYG